MAVDEAETMGPGAMAIQQWLVARIAEHVRVDPLDVDPQEPFANYGLGSMDAVVLAGDLEDWLGQELPPTLVWDYPTIEQLSHHLATRGALPRKPGAG